MLDYNVADRRLYFYDRGYMLSANVRVVSKLNDFLPPTTPSN